MVSTQYRRVSGPIIPHIYVKQKKNDFSLSQTMGFHDTCGILGSVTDPKIQLLYPKENSLSSGKSEWNQGWSGSGKNNIDEENSLLLLSSEKHKMNWMNEKV